MKPVPILELVDVRVNRGGRRVLDVDHLVVHQGEILTIIGPNGAGKSTLLLVAAGLLKPDQGKVLFMGSGVTPGEELAFRRRVGLVLQKPLLLNSSVVDNVTIGHRFRHVAKKERRQSAQLWLERFGIAHLADRPAKTLSGGEAQRVSLARAFTLNPEIVLLDEPFSALDRPTRTALTEDFHSLIVSTSFTAVFVTHDMDEALHLGHRIAVLLEGQIRQVGSPDQVFSTPADPDVAAFVGIETSVTGQVMKAKDGVLTVAVGAHLLDAVGELPVGSNVLFCVRPDDVTLWSDDDLPTSSARNRLAGLVSSLSPRGTQVQVVVDCGFLMRVLITRSSAAEMALDVGKSVVLTFKASAVHLIPQY